MKDEEFLERIYKLKRKRGIYINKDGKKVITLSSSLMKDISFKGVYRQVCPSWLFYKSICRMGPDMPTESMKKGLYFESHILGRTSSGKAVDFEFERKRNGEKYAWHERIDMQIARFERLADEFGLIINPIDNNGNVIRNTQIHQEFPFEFPELSKKYPDYEFIMMMDIDLISPVKNIYGEFDAAIIDLKLTGDIETTYGEHAWGSVEDMDHVQAYTYSYFMGLPFFYLVFDYSPRLNYNWFPIITDTNSSNEYIKKEAMIRMEEYKQRIISTIDYIVAHEENSWWYIKIPTNCKTCPLLKYCEIGRNNLLI